MTWQEFIEAQHVRDIDPDWSFEAWITFRELATNDRELLKAFADELKKRLKLWPDPGMKHQIQSTINEMLDNALQHTINEMLTEVEVNE